MDNRQARGGVAALVLAAALLAAGSASATVLPTRTLDSRLGALSLEDFDDMHVVGADESVIGAVDGVVREPHTGELFAIVDVGGFLGGNDRVLLPVDQLVPTGIDDELMLLGATEEAVKLHMLYDEDGAFEPVEGYATLGEAYLIPVE